MSAMNAVLIILLLLLISLAVVTAARKMRRGGGCCGEHEAAEKKVAAADRNKSHYPWAATLGIGGMTCENCSRKVENALNTLKGTWASVSISSHSARVLCKGSCPRRRVCGHILSDQARIEEISSSGILPDRRPSFLSDGFLAVYFVRCGKWTTNIWP